MKKFIPFAHAKNIYEVDPKFFLDNGIKTLFLDLDNTLDSYKAKFPSMKAKELIYKLRSNGLDVIIISNNREKRVKGYASELDTKYMFKSFKPFAFRVNKFIKQNNINKEESMIVGDQLLTDVLFGHNAKVRVLLTEKLVKEDQPTTRFNRLFDVPLRKRLNKKGLLIDWRNKYVTR